MRLVLRCILSNAVKKAQLACSLHAPAGDHSFVSHIPHLGISCHQQWKLLRAVSSTEWAGMVYAHSCPTPTRGERGWRLGARSVIRLLTCQCMR